MVKVSDSLKSAITAADDRIAAGWYLESYFRKAGVTVLGAGMYGAAIEDQGNVFKVFSSDERGYGAFLTYLKGKSSILYPRVKTVGTFGAYQCVHIERLYPLTDSMSYEDATKFAAWASYIARKGNAKAVGAGNARHFKTRFPQAAAKFCHQLNMTGMLTKLGAWMAENGDGVGFDLHRGNFMMRHNADGTRQIVLTDPFCNQ
jgi:hypothetical protein